MTIEVDQIKNLFLVKDMREYESAVALVRTGAPDDSVILTIDTTHPYLIDKYPDLDGVGSWEEFGILDPLLSRYWLTEYREIEEIILKEMPGNVSDDNEMANSPYFTMNLIWHMGKNYYQYIDKLNKFFDRCRPEVVYFNPAGGFIGDLVSSFCGLYESRSRDLPL